MKKTVVLIALLTGPFSALPLFAHAINYALQNAPAGDVAWYYFKLGFQHIIPAGADHILFIAGLCLTSTNIRGIFWQASAFTVAHSVTLALSMKNIVLAPSAIVEPVIALSILFLAVENMLTKQNSRWRVAMVFFFGLLHGMGFASSLNETGLPPDRFYTSIIAFNIGVEIGQLAVITAVFTLIINRFKNQSWYKKIIVNGLSVLIAIIAFYWAVERVVSV